MNEQHMTLDQRDSYNEQIDFRNACVQFGLDLISVYRRVLNHQLNCNLLYYKAEKVFLKNCSQLSFPLPTVYREDFERALKSTYQYVEALRVRGKHSGWELERILVAKTFNYLGEEFPF